MLQIITH